MSRILPTTPTPTDPQSPRKSFGQKVSGVFGTMFQGVGTAAAHVDQVPIVGLVLIRPIAFAGENTRIGFTEARARILAKKAMDGKMDPLEAAKKGLLKEEKDTIDAAIQSAQA